MRLVTVDLEKNVREHACGYTPEVKKMAMRGFISEAMLDRGMECF